MTSDIVTFILNLLLSFTYLLVKVILLPIDLLVKQFLPSVNDAFTAVGEFLTLIAQGLGWAISAAGIPYASIALVATYYIFKLTFPLVMWGIKLMIKWYTTIKP